MSLIECSALIQFFPSSSISIIGFILCTNLAMALLWNSTNPAVMKVMDEEADSSTLFAFITDPETCLSIGRSFGLIVLLGVLYGAGPSTAITLTPAILAPLQIVVVLGQRVISRNY